MEGTFYIKHVGQMQSITNQKTGEQIAKLSIVVSTKEVRMTNKESHFESQNDGYSKDINNKEIPTGSNATAIPAEGQHLVDPIMRTITKLILHCSASLEGVNLSGNDIRSYHSNPVRRGGRGWRRTPSPQGAEEGSSCFRVAEEFTELSDMLSSKINTHSDTLPWVAPTRDDPL